MKRITSVLWLSCVLLGLPLIDASTIQVHAAELRGRVLDADSGAPLAARVYLRNSNQEWLFVKSADANGSALEYREQWVPMPDSIEQHTTVSAHPFQIVLPDGEYTLEVERGKEYLPFTRTFRIDGADIELTIELQRWIDMASRGWFSGETHVHRRIAELPNVMLAEDLNVAFPVTYWTIQSDAAPGLEPSPLRRQGPSPFGPRQDHGFAPIAVDATHVILPRNTEYEIFSVDGKRHVLGAIFVLNHRSVFTRKAPPIQAIAEQAHAEGALLDLDKHSWPWSMMLVPVAGIDLFELSNNSVWRTRFGFRQTSTPPADWMNVERDGPDSLTEWGWLNFGFEVYYALLNCGFRISPTAGTASGVHPVPLGHSRVYVETPAGFSTEAWLRGLKQGRSFVTTGPMLLATIDGQPAGTTRRWSGSQPLTVNVKLQSLSQRPVERIEILVNGRVVKTVPGRQNREVAERSWHVTSELPVTLTESSWIALRSIEPQPDGRQRFAHTAPWYFSHADEPIRPRRQQIDYLVEQVTREIERNREVLSDEALAEFQQALRIYQQIAERAHPD